MTRDLRHGARSTVRNGSHRATQGDAVRQVELSAVISSM